MITINRSLKSAMDRVLLKQGCIFERIQWPITNSWMHAPNSFRRKRRRGGRCLSCRHFSLLKFEFWHRMHPPNLTSSLKNLHPRHSPPPFSQVETPPHISNPNKQRPSLPPPPSPPPPRAQSSQFPQNIHISVRLILYSSHR